MHCRDRYGGRAGGIPGGCPSPDPASGRLLLGLHERPQAPVPESAGGSVASIIARVRRLLDDEEAAGAAIRTLGKWRDRESVARISDWLRQGKSHGG